ncbi:O-antigen ligase family protein [Schwartzia succinivorans]|uniref:O-antigen ligase family protein n=1 Tax=Schwartzia succinivorans TaxID=55507 RepID=UPI002352880B|nr:O-antigen ligase family protein [Schwartzia succinivorans]
MDRHEQYATKVETWIFYFMCGFALFSSVSMAGGNLFLSLGLVASFVRLYYKRDDVTDILYKNKTLAYLFAAMIGAICVSFIASEHPVHSMRVFGDHYGYRMCGFYIIMLFVREREKLLKLLGLAAISCVLNGIHCIWEFIVLGNTRADGFYFYMTTGTILSMWTPLTLLIALETFEKKKHCVFAVFGVVFMVVVQFCNQTRGAWVATAITSLMLVFMYMRSLKKAIAIFVSLVIGIGIIFACVPQLNQRLSSITEVKSGGDRIYLWKSAYHMFLDNPFLGVGYNQFADKYQNQYILPEARQPKLNHAHSNFMQMLAEGGILGITTWSLFWGYALWYGYSGWKKDRKISALAWFVVIAGFQLHGLTEYNQGNSAATKEFWFLLGIFLQLMWISKHNSKIKLR